MAGFRNIAPIITTAPGNAALIQDRYVIPIGFPQDLQVAGIPGLKNAFLKAVIPGFSQWGHLYIFSPNQFHTISMAAIRVDLYQIFI